MNYMSTNDLVANSDKTELLVCRPKKGKNNPTPLHINIGGYDVEESTSVKLLGMHISNDLSWAEHVRQLEKHLHHILFTLRWVKSKISKTHLIRVAEGIFISRIMYGISIYCPIPKKENYAQNKILKTLQNFQNKAMRVILGKKVSDKVRISDMLKECGWLSINQMAIKKPSC